MKTLVLCFKKSEIIKVGEIEIERHFTHSGKVVIRAPESIQIQRIKRDISGLGNDRQKSKHNRNFNRLPKNKEHS